jgi:glycosyltransferase involved in cell wall biosynthesis
MQIKMTAKYLQELNINVNIKLANEPIEYAQYDLLHFFNIIRPDAILPHIQKTNLPFVLSPIMVDYYEYEKKNRQGLLGYMNKVLDRDSIELVKRIARAVKNKERITSQYYLLNGHRKSIQYVAQKAALFLPNSHTEYNRFVKLYKVKPPYHKVVNGIDPSAFNISVKPNPSYKNHVLCVGRIEGIKNQLNLIKAIKDTDLQLTLVGKPAPNHLAYYQQCQQIASESKNIRLIGQVNHEELAAMYKAAKVHVLPSWFETTGLSSLEAGVMGCNLVVSRKGDTEEYFQDMAYYCEPDDINSIQKAIYKAFQDPINPMLQQYILNNYTWKHTAEQTLQAYKLVLEGSDR